MPVWPIGQGEGTKLGEWPSYAGDLRNFHYSPLDQINGGNFNQLEVAWRFKTDSLGSRPGIAWVRGNPAHGEGRRLRDGGLAAGCDRD